MSKFLEDLYYGDYCPCEKGFPDDPVLNTLNPKILDLEEQLMSSITKEQQCMLNDYFDTINEIHDREELYRFCDGLKFAIRLLAEALMD